MDKRLFCKYGLQRESRWNFFVWVILSARKFAGGTTTTDDGQHQIGRVSVKTQRKNNEDGKYSIIAGARRHTYGCTDTDAHRLACVHIRKRNVCTILYKTDHRQKTHRTRRMCTTWILVYLGFRALRLCSLLQLIHTACACANVLWENFGMCMCELSSCLLTRRFSCISHSMIYATRTRCGESVFTDWFYFCYCFSAQTQHHC